MKEGRSKVSIIIPNYNGREYLKRLLPSIANQTYDSYEVIILDDCSPDRFAEEYIKAFVRDCDNMRLVENKENLGFVRNCNKGFRLANGDYVCLLTNDTEVKSDFVKRNVEIMDSDRSIGVLSCIIVDEDGNSWFSGGTFRRGRRVNLRDDFQSVRSVDWVAGTAPFYRREVFDKVGLLNEDFVMYHEDMEFCLRVRNETDYKVCVFPEKLVTHNLHLHSVQFDLARVRRLYYYGHRNHILLLRKYSPKHIPKILLCYLGEIVSLPIVPLLKAKPKAKPKSFLLSLYVILLVIRGTLDGLTQKESR